MRNATLPSDLAAARIINAAGTLTRLAGARVSPDVAAAMAEAAGLSFDMWALQAAASRRLAEATGAEAGLVTTGAAAGLTLAAAAVIAGLDAARMDRLPQTAGMPHEIIVPRTHRNAYDRALRVAGATLVDVGVADRETGAGIRGLEAWEVEAAISPMTVALAASASEATIGDVPVLSAVARKHRLPLIVDAAAQLPPRANLRAIIAAGASLVVYSGGKAIGGPQASGILAGDRRFIASAALQMLDMDIRPEAIVPPPEFFAGLNLPAIPRHGIGRGFKASKEAIVGLLIALDAFCASDPRANQQEVLHRLQTIAQALSGLTGATATIREGRSETLPKLDVRLMGAPHVSARLKAAALPVHVAEGRINEGVLTIDLIAVAPEDDTAIIAAFRAACAT